MIVLRVTAVVLVVLVIVAVVGYLIDRSGDISQGASSR
jgi:succinate dehydrogenase hydrophobic anchor subunit